MSSGNVNLPLVTVGMVTYNSSKYVRHAIESVLSQSYENLELVICDDCSTDGTWEIIKSFNDSRIRAHRNFKNLREYPNRNQVIDFALGEYLIFIDGDDILYPHGLEYMVTMLHAFPDSAVAVCRPWNEKVLFPLEVSPIEIYSFEYLGTGIMGINFTQILFKTKALKEVGSFDVAIKTGDTHVQFKLALENNFLVINEGNAWWRRTEGQASEAVLKSPTGIIESTKYRLKFLQDSRCPLSPNEKMIAVNNLYGIYYRDMIRTFIKGKFLDSFKIFKAFPFSFPNLLKIFIRANFSYCNQVNAANPLTSGLSASPYYRSKKRV
ncbi:glycosyltransferase family 2 protein [Botryobacter ruber]|uniref:glycosyltransferase family 2 protein n=1 Tax=Botryobacter ruber TaxID=2171629 RepID=UPI000E0B2778|nr:glycosyltransferase family 2 protein [Botryobacter ruber]